MIKPQLLFTVMAGGFLLGACATLDPTYRRPPLAAPQTFPHANAAPAASMEAAKIGRRDVLIDPKLRAIVDLGLANNRDIKIAVANIDSARALYRVQRANLVPHLSANLGATYAREPLAALTQGAATAAGGASGHVTEHLYTADLGVSSYEVDLFGRVRSLTRAALERYLATDEARRAAQISLVSEIAAAWLTLAADEGVLESARATETSAAASLTVTKGRLDAGVASALDVEQAQTLVQQTRADVANDATIVDQDRNALRLLVGTEPPEALLPDPLGPGPVVAADLPAGLPAAVLLNRPDVLEAEHQLRAQNADIGAARAAFFPSIILTGSGGGTSTAFSALFKGASSFWSFVPNVSLPIFTGGANQGNLAYAKAQRDLALAQYEKAVQSAFRDVANALARRATIDEQLAADEAAAAAAGRSLDLASARYARGADTYLNVLTAQRTFYATRVSLIEARLSKASNLVTLYAALGGGES